MSDNNSSVHNSSDNNSSDNNFNIKPIIHIPSIVAEAEQNIIEDIINFDGTEEAEFELYDNIQFFIKMKQSTLPNLKTFLMNKTDLYIMSEIHGEMKYDLVSIPKSLHFFRIIAVPFGVCNISTEAIYTEIFNNLKKTIQKTYKNTRFARQPVQKISQVLKSVQSTLYEINNRVVDPENKSDYNDEFQKYSHIPPRISEFRVGDKIINKEFFTNLIIVNGKLSYEGHIHIASHNGNSELNFFDRLNLLDYLVPSSIQHVPHTNEWTLTYKMQDIIDLLEAKHIKRAVFIDLSCSNNAQNNTKTVMKKTEGIEGTPYMTVRATRKIRNKNTQYAPKRRNKNVVFNEQYRPHSRSSSTKGKSSSRK